MDRKSGPHVMHKLTALAVNKMNRPGTFADGGNLYLRVANTGSKSWVFRFMLGGKVREMGLGSLAIVDLTAARETCRSLRQQLADGIDPLAAREAVKQEQLAAAAAADNAARTWQWCCETYVSTVKAPELLRSG